MKPTKSLLVILILFSHCSSNPENIPQSESSRLSKEYFRLAEQGNALAQYNLGLKYQNGQGVSEDQQEAFKWYELSAKQGHPQAQANLGRMYEKGQGELPKDLSSERQSNVSLVNFILYLSLPILLIIQHSSEKYLLNQKRNFCLICL